MAVRNMPVYRIWVSIKGVCYNKNHSSYRYYGAKGIRVCDKWRNDFHAFFKDMGDIPPNPKSWKPPRGWKKVRHYYKLARKDPEKDYCPKNCFWGANESHGNTNSFAYKSWASMRSRCSNSNDPTYKHYGGRGIKVCKRWESSFENFYADMGDPPKGRSVNGKRRQYSLGRIDNNKGYSPSNCRWENYQQQRNNTRKTKYISFQGSKMTLAQWAKHLGLHKDMLILRIKRGLPLEQVLSRQKYPNRRICG